MVFSQMLRSLAPSSATLTTLHIDFNPGDRDILRCISEVAPNLTALKLCNGRILSSSILSYQHVYLI